MQKRLDINALILPISQLETQRQSGVDVIIDRPTTGLETEKMRNMCYGVALVEDLCCL